jgi:hypothetical protein
MLVNTMLNFIRECSKKGIGEEPKWGKSSNFKPDYTIWLTIPNMRRFLDKDGSMGGREIA